LYQRGFAASVRAGALHARGRRLGAAARQVALMVAAAGGDMEKQSSFVDERMC
jgi:hypothetical protein